MDNDVFLFYYQKMADIVYTIDDIKKQAYADAALNEKANMESVEESIAGYHIFKDSDAWLDLSGPRIPWIGNNIFKHVIHLGQRKLLLSECLMLAEHMVTGQKYTVVYAGSYPGDHVPFLLSIFQDIEHIHLYDPNPKGLTLENYKTDRYNINGRYTVYQLPFTDETAEYWRDEVDKTGINLIFISDIRRDASDEDMIMADNEWQFNWVKIMDPIVASLKFRAPFKNESFKFKIPNAPIMMQTRHGPTSTETRMIISKGMIHKPWIEIDGQIYESRLFCINNEREYLSWHLPIDEAPKMANGICNCRDCAFENYIWEKVIAKIYPETNMQTVTLFSRASAALKPLRAESHATYTNGFYITFMDKVKAVWCSPSFKIALEYNEFEVTYIEKDYPEDMLTMPWYTDNVWFLAPDLILRKRMFSDGHLERILKYRTPYPSVKGEKREISNTVYQALEIELNNNMYQMICDYINRVRHVAFERYPQLHQLITLCRVQSITDNDVDDSYRSNNAQMIKQDKPMFTKTVFYDEHIIEIPDSDTNSGNASITIYVKRKLEKREGLYTREFKTEYEMHVPRIDTLCHFIANERHMLERRHGDYFWLLMCRSVAVSRTMLSTKRNDRISGESSIKHPPVHTVTPRGVTDGTLLNMYACGPKVNGLPAYALITSYTQHHKDGRYTEYARVCIYVNNIMKHLDYIQGRIEENGLYECEYLEDDKILYLFDCVWTNSDPHSEHRSPVTDRKTTMGLNLSARRRVMERNLSKVFNQIGQNGFVLVRRPLHIIQAMNMNPKNHPTVNIYDVAFDLDGVKERKQLEGTIDPEMLDRAYPILPTDGCVFTPIEASYPMLYTNCNIYKWKTVCPNPKVFLDIQYNEHGELTISDRPYNVMSLWDDIEPGIWCCSCSNYNDEVMVTPEYYSPNHTPTPEHILQYYLMSAPTIGVLTIDLMVHSGKLYSSAGGNNVEPFMGSDDFPLTNIEWSNEDLASYDYRIVEFAYEIGGTLCDVRIRNDKTRPNPTGIVNEVWAQMNSPVTITDDSIYGRDIYRCRHITRRKITKYIEESNSTSHIVEIGAGHGSNMDAFIRHHPDQITLLEPNEVNFTRLKQRRDQRVKEGLNIPITLIHTKVNLDADGGKVAPNTFMSDIESPDVWMVYIDTFMNPKYYREILHGILVMFKKPPAHIHMVVTEMNHTWKGLDVVVKQVNADNRTVRYIYNQNANVESGIQYVTDIKKLCEAMRYAVTLLSVQISPNVKKVYKLNGKNGVVVKKLMEGDQSYPTLTKEERTYLGCQTYIRFNIDEENIDTTI